MTAINFHAPVKCSQQIEINVPIQKVWSIITDIDNWSVWQPSIKKTELMGGLQVGTKFKWRTGGAGITSTLHTVKEPNYFGWTGKTYGMYAIHNWTFQKTTNGTLVQVDESMEGFLAILLRKSFNKNLNRDMSNWLSCLKKECER